MAPEQSMVDFQNDYGIEPSAHCIIILQQMLDLWKKLILLAYSHKNKSMVPSQSTVLLHMHDF